MGAVSFHATEYVTVNSSKSSVLILMDILVPIIENTTDGEKPSLLRDRLRMKLRHDLAGIISRHPPKSKKGFVSEFGGQYNDLQRGSCERMCESEELKIRAIYKYYDSDHRAHFTSHEQD